MRRSRARQGLWPIQAPRRRPWREGRGASRARSCSATERPRAAGWRCTESCTTSRAFWASTPGVLRSSWRTRARTPPLPSTPWATARPPGICWPEWPSRSWLALPRPGQLRRTAPRAVASLPAGPGTTLCTPRTTRSSTWSSSPGSQRPPRASWRCAPCRSSGRRCVLSQALRPLLHWLSRPQRCGSVPSPWLQGGLHHRPRLLRRLRKAPRAMLRRIRRCSSRRSAARRSWRARPA
mmetsp:Transcript_34930/g.107283  ORF Transcript_34930/g.107283 Transcript_34930/m.107283 type:complete len:237 (+) Transcript_34930:543-1253(+)